MLAADKLKVRSGRPDATTFVRMFIEPGIALATLAVATAWFETGGKSAYVILGLLVFAMTFPGRTEPVARGFAGLACATFGTWGSIVAVLLALGWATDTLAAFDGRVITAWVLATPFVLLAARGAVPRLLERTLAAGGSRKTAVIVGANEMGRMLARRIESNTLLGMRFSGYFDDRKDERTADIRRGDLLGSLDDLASYVKVHNVDVIYCALPMSSQPRVLKLLDELHDTTASIYFVPDILLFDLIQARIDSVGGIPTIALCESPYFGLNAWIKRGSDLLLGGAIVSLIAPLLLFIAIGVKLSSPGPVLFRQRRYGADGREIVVYKFRTMTCLEDGDVVEQAKREDARVTRFGGLLRRYSLDELPQFLNVLQGRMSVVGPRPHAVAHNEMYRKLIRGYMMRHKVKPGITGLAQVNGCRGETDTVDKMRARIEHDLEYLRNWSLLLDLKIVLMTLGVFWDKQNAY